MLAHSHAYVHVQRDKKGMKWYIPEGWDIPLPNASFRLYFVPLSGVGDRKPKASYVRNLLLMMQKFSEFFLLDVEHSKIVLPA